MSARQHKGNPWPRRMGQSAIRCGAFNSRIEVFSWTDLHLYWVSRKILPRWCVYCGALSQTLDHVVPIRRGGPHAMENLVPACVACNSDKGSMLLHAWLQITGRPLIQPVTPQLLGLTIRSNTLIAQLGGAHQLSRFKTGGFDTHGNPPNRPQKGRR